MSAPAWLENLPPVPYRQRGVEPDRLYRLSRYMLMRPHGDGFVAESLITGRLVPLPNAVAVRTLLSLSMPTALGNLLGDTAEPKAVILLSFFNQCLQSGLICEVREDGTSAEGTGGNGSEKPGVPSF